MFARRISVLGVGLLSLAALGFTLASVEAGEMTIIESNVPEIAVNSRLPDDMQPMLPAGSRIKVLRQDNTIQIFEGTDARSSSAHVSPHPLPYGGVRGDKD
jgi:hypothetical protein